MKEMSLLPLLLIAATAAPAAEPLRLQTRVLAETRTAAPDGTVRTALAAPSRVGPGDRIVVQVAYRNAGTQPIAGLVIANPLPRGMAYRAPRAPSPAPEVSVDGRSFGALSDLRVAVSGGGERAAGADDVTHVRWRISNPVAAGAGGEFAFQAVVR